MELLTSKLNYLGSKAKPSSGMILLFLSTHPFSVAVIGSPSLQQGSVIFTGYLTRIAFCLDLALFCFLPFGSFARVLALDTSVRIVFLACKRELLRGVMVVPVVACVVCLVPFGRGSCGELQVEAVEIFGSRC